MDHHQSNHWQQMFDAKRRERPPGTEQGFPFGQPGSTSQPAPLGSFDDGHDPALRQAGGEPPHAPLSPEEITDEAAMALALDTAEYKPWVLQRGRSRPALMLHLRRYEPKSGLWMGWQLSYPHLIAVEYVGDKMLSLDFGTRQFVIEGNGLDELARHLQSGSVLLLQEFSNGVWKQTLERPIVTAIKRINDPRAG